MPAIVYDRNAFDTGGSQIFGLQSANRNFLEALARDDRFPELSCYTPDEKEFNSFRSIVDPIAPSAKSIGHIPFGDHAGLSRAGVLHRCDPSIAPYLWQRRWSDQHLYSLTGIIHSISSRAIMEAIGALVIAPLQSWDALICTSKSGQEAVRTILNNWTEYLAQRLNAQPKISIRLPVIPLGIDCDAFQPTNAADMRSRMRAQLSIAESDIAVLSVGRLAFKRKSHPVPMYLALQRAKQATGAQVHLIQAGQFEDDKEEGAFHAAASEFCPDVRTHVVGGRHAFRDQSVWFAGDIFLSLSDNIQETFGLAPVEAMAVGLPAVVSDWDGYRDTIRDGVDGFRIVTTFPQPSSGVDLSERYYGFANYRHYYGTVAMSTAVDIDACAEALARLIREPALRNRMGASGRLRARTTYDWRVVLRAYRQLWSMLADERQGNDVVAPTSLGRAPYPLCDDPFRVFSAHATRTLAPDTVLSLTNASANEVLDRLRRSWLTHFGAEWRLGREAIVRILGRIERSGSITVAELADDASVPQAQLQRTLAYLLKFGIVRIADRD